MTRAKLVGKILLWALRLSFFLLGPSLLLLVFSSIITRPNPPLILACSVTSLLAVGYLYYGLTCDLAFPHARPQTDCPRLIPLAAAFAAGSTLSLALYLGLAWLKYRGTIYSGSSPFFLVPETILSFCLVSTVFLWFGCFVLWLLGHIKNARQLLFLTWMVALTVGMGPILFRVTEHINARKSQPFWEVRRATTGSDNEIYYFLREGPMQDAPQGNDKRFQKRKIFSAVARHLGSNLFFIKVDIIFSAHKSQNPQGALLMGKYHRNAIVREVSEKMLQRE